MGLNFVKWAMINNEQTGWRFLVQAMFKHVGHSHTLLIKFENPEPGMKTGHAGTSLESVPSDPDDS